jgi:hypothetical protein
MHLVRRKGQVVYEDLLRELELIEQRLLPEDSGAAMSLMVLEAKLRERFQKLDLIAQGALSSYDEADDEPLIETHEMSALIPRDLPMHPERIRVRRIGAGTLETVAVAAMLAVVTACAVFGIASALQMALTWLA